ncbi:MAG: rod shape-determining protein [Acidobacteriota bacterium]|nr:rod shape-determining protein [Acidobacteriota bacterium]MDH3522029.1 rod shape-determining protein [Acidobacteriota bacterium]
MAEQRTPLSVGVDLGTSRSAVSASTGARQLVLSYVGWPLDMVARRVVKKEVLIGEEALENRLMLDLHRPLERGLIKEGADRDARAVRELLKHVLSLAGTEAAREEGRAVRAVVGVPAEAMRVNKQQLRSAMAGLVESLMIVSEPFAVAYGLDALLHALIVDIGAGTTDLCVMNGRYPRDEDQKTLTAAGDSIDEQLQQLIQARFPEANFSRHMVTAWKESGSFVGELSGKIMVTAPVQGRPTKFDITEEMRTACASLVPPVVEAMLDLISRVEPEYQAKVRNNVILTGGSSLISGLGAALQEALKEVGGGKVRVVKDPAFVGADGGLAIATDAPDSDWETLTA